MEKKKEELLFLISSVRLKRNVIITDKSIFKGVYMYFLIPLPFVLVFTFLVQQTKASGDFALAAIYQPLTTCFLIAMALLSLLNKKARKPYTFWITGGLILSLGGDFSIIDPADQGRLMIGLIFFLAAHIVYAVGFTVLSGFQKQDKWTGTAFIAIFLAFIIFLWPGLKDMTIPVILYAAALSFMAFRAVSTVFGTYFTRVQSICIAAGGLLFFIADSQLAVSLFRMPISLEYGPYLYYGGQLLLALSPSLFMIEAGSKST